jgi:UDP-N-acetylglucosamine enolpyruvyl transferase
MDRIIIKGGRPLNGRLPISGAKNARRLRDRQPPC